MLNKKIARLLLKQHENITVSTFETETWGFTLTKVDFYSSEPPKCIKTFNRFPTTSVEISVDTKSLQIPKFNLNFKLQKSNSVFIKIGRGIREILYEQLRENQKNGS